VKATVVINAESSRSERHIAQLREMLEAHAIEIEHFALVDSHVALRKRVRRAVKRDARLVIVGGGDGTMTEAVNVLAHEKAVLGILPLGTGNSFAQTLRIGTDLRSAIEVIAAGREVRVDLGVMNKRYFANFATIGLSAEIAASTSRELKHAIGAAAYAVAGIKPFVTHPAFRANVRWEDGDMRLSTKQMVIASGRIFGKRPVTPDASITDGRLAFFTSTGISQLEVARMYVAFGLGLQTLLPDAQTLSARKITVKTSPKQPVNLDGEAWGTTPARFSIDPRALRVMVPQEFVDAAN